MVEVKELESLLIQSAEEIRQLRQHIAILAPKARAHDMMEVVLGLVPRPNQGAGVDVVWNIQRGLESIRRDRATPSQQNTVPGKSADAPLNHLDLTDKLPTSPDGRIEWDKVPTGDKAPPKAESTSETAGLQPS